MLKSGTCDLLKWKHIHYNCCPYIHSAVQSDLGSSGTYNKEKVLDDGIHREKHTSVSRSIHLEIVKCKKTKLLISN